MSLDVLPVPMAIRPGWLRSTLGSSSALGTHALFGGSSTRGLHVSSSSCASRSYAEGCSPRGACSEGGSGAFSSCGGGSDVHATSTVLL